MYTKNIITKFHKIRDSTLHSNKAKSKKERYCFAITKLFCANEYFNIWQTSDEIFW